MASVIFVIIDLIHGLHAVYYVGPAGWKKMSGDDVGELHYSYYQVQEAPAEAEMGEA